MRKNGLAVSSQDSLLLSLSEARGPQIGRIPKEFGRAKKESPVTVPPFESSPGDGPPYLSKRSQ